MPKIILETPDRRPDSPACIILTSFGRDQSLKKAISSVLEQSYKNLNLIIIDDNSESTNKKTLPIIQQFLHDKRIIFFRTQTTPHERFQVSTFCRNINFCLQFLLKYKKVKYISYLACDDYYHPNRIKDAVDFLEVNKQINSCWQYFSLTYRNKEIGKIPGTSQKTVLSPSCLIDHNCVTHRLSLINMLQYPYWPQNKHTEHVAPDGEFFNKLIGVGGAMHKVNNKVAGEKIRHPNSIQGRRNGW